MVHGRIETTPEQQLIDLRKAYERYVALADVLHDSGDAALDADERQAREHYARRIAHAYEKTIANTSARMESMRRDHMVDHSFRRWMVIAVLIVIGGLFASSALLAAFLPEIFRPVVPRQAHSASPAMVASAAKPAPVAAPAIAPSAALPPAAQPVIAPRAPAAIKAPAPNSAAGRANATTPAPTARPATALNAKVETPKASAPRVATPTREAPPARVAEVPRVTPPPARETPPARVAEAPRVTPPPQTATPSAATPAPASTPPAAAPVPPPVVTATAAPNPPPAATTSPATVSSAPVNTPAPVLRDTSVQTAALPPVTAPASTPATPKPRLESIASTHRPPPYPDMSKRAGEQGTTQMQVAISTAGVITDCNVIGTSGSQRLDAAACSYVQAHWKWQPPLKDGQPASVTTKISVIWSLATAARN